MRWESEYEPRVSSGLQTSTECYEFSVLRQEARYGVFVFIFTFTKCVHEDDVNLPRAGRMLIAEIVSLGLAGGHILFN